MGMDLCRKHGLTGISFACVHVVAATQQAQTIKSVPLLTNFIYAEKTLLCESCNTDFINRFPDSALVTQILEQWAEDELDEATSAFLDTLYQPVCSRCFREFQQANSSSPDSFDPNL
jgi:hypothetical protein